MRSSSRPGWSPFCSPDRMRPNYRSGCLSILGVLAAGSDIPAAARAQPFVVLKVSAKARLAAIRRAQVWSPTNVGAMDLKAGPKGPDAFAPNELLTCQYRDKAMSGATPKFTCVIGQGDEVKVKYGAENGEVYGEVAATRLLWALGFPAPIGCTRSAWRVRAVPPIRTRTSEQQRTRCCSIPPPSSERSRARRWKSRPTPAGRGKSWTMCERPPAARRLHTAMR